MSAGVKFALVLDAAGREVRTWDNLGRAEEIATGSAAGPVAAHLFAHNLADPVVPLEIAQGRFAGRLSRIKVARGFPNRQFCQRRNMAVVEDSLEIDFPSSRAS